MMRFTPFPILLAVISLLGAATLRADVKLPAIFGDHMVLQAGIKLPVWGTASPGESVTVTVGKEKAKTTAGADGKWSVDLAPLPTKAAPVTLTVQGTNLVTFNDVLVGEVWLCSGQSNMEFNLGGGKYGFGGAHDTGTALAQENDPQLRLFLVQKKLSLTPLDDVQGQWEVCTPASAGKFSAVGYFFGRDLRKVLNHPVGLIGSYWGGTPAQGWTSIEALESEPVLDGYVKAHEKIIAAAPAATAAYPAELTDFKAKQAEWQKTYGKDYNEAMAAWKSAVAQATPGVSPPSRPAPPSPIPRPPVSPDGGPGAPGNLFNAMIAPLVHYGIKGAIWYQGESNSSRSHEYRTLFPTMIKDWRSRWAEGDFPFLFVQLASYRASSVQSWPYLREAQAMTLSLPNTGMATGVDIGDPGNIHPKDKTDVGARLALIARHLAYGEKKLPDSGPVYKTMTVSGDKINLTFGQIDGGLIIGQAPWVAPGQTPIPADKLEGFSIAGADQKFVPAEAKIKGSSVVVSSPQVAIPVAVRYDWENAPRGNLYNQAKLPAPPFRTDDWTDAKAEGIDVPGVAK